MFNRNFNRKLMRRIVNYVVERWFPNGAFFGKDYFDSFSEIDRRSGTMSYAASMYLLKIITEINATNFSIELDSITINGDECGDWIITIQQVSEGADHPRDLKVPDADKVTEISITTDM